MLSSLMLVRELRGRGRWGSTYILRTVYVLLLGGLVALAVSGRAGWRFNAAYSLGREIFGAFVWAQSLAVFLYALFSAAGSLAAERRGGTLDLLLLGGARPREIARAKGLAAFVPGLLLVAGSAPFLFTLVGLGGVAPVQAAGLALFSLSLAFLGAALGLIGAALANSESEVNPGACAAAFFWLAILPLLVFLGFLAGEWLTRPAFHSGRELGRLPLFLVTLGCLSPVPALIELAEPSGDLWPGAWPCWFFAGLLNFAAGWFLFSRVGRLLARRLRLGPTPAAGFAPPRRGAPFRAARPAAGAGRRRRGEGGLPGDDPVAWRERLVTGGFAIRSWRFGFAVMSLVVAGLSVLIGLIVLCAAPPRDAARILPWLPCWIAFALGCGVLCGLGAVPLYALQAFAGERRERTGEQLLLTALHPGDIVLGKLKGLLGGGGPLALAGALLAAAGGLPLAINEYAGSSWARVAEDILGPTVLTVTIGCSLLIFLTLAALLVSLSVPNAGLGLLALALIGGLGQLFIGGITSLAQETAGWALALPVYLGGNALGCAALYFIAVGRVRAGLTAR